jgi:oligopeptide/dipeptide ABC transporter ATP-binding protein
MTALLELKHVTKVFGHGPTATVALDDFSLAISSEVPSFTTVAGESGSGKTTLARLLLGFTAPTSGEVLYRGKDLAKLSPGGWHTFRHEVQAIFQDPFSVFNPFYKVDHLLAVPIEMFRLARSKPEARAKMEKALAAVGLRPEETLGRYPHQLSGGQRQRLTIARALLLQPRLIIADEPVSMVDASLRATILETLRTLHLDFGISFLYITHDLTTAYQISQNIIILYRGSIAEVGDVDLVIGEPKHPYSQLLISSIPEPDLRHRWNDDDVLPAAVDADGQQGGGCKFADRCPARMAICDEQVPPLYRTEPTRAAACFLYRDSARVGLDRVSDVLTQNAPPASSTE